MSSHSYKGSFVVKNIVCLSFIALFRNVGYTQQQNVPINFSVTQKIEKSTFNSGEYLHSAIKPFLQSNISEESYNKVFKDTGLYYYDFHLKLYAESLLDIEEDDVKLVADPLFNIGWGKTMLKDTNLVLTTNTRGVRVAGNITSKFSFETRYYENQIYYPDYLDSIADERGIAFGLGRAKLFKENGHDVGMSSGYISYSPTEKINIQFGQGKHFIGNGYRSMLLSDNAFNYPYLSLSLKLLEGKLFYKSVSAWLQTLERMPASSSPEALYKRKSGSFRYLSFKPTKQIEFGLFEGVVYKRYQDSVGEVNVDPSFYIPAIGVSSILNLGNEHNKVILGGNINIKPVQNVLLYSQVVLDDLSRMGLPSWWKMV